MLQRPEVKNLSIKIIIELILLSTPQFLTYTFPFSTLTSTAMVIGDLSEKNEIMAARSLGISLRNIFLPLLLSSFICAIGTFFIADIVNPWASKQYKRVYATIIHDMPTIALKPNSTTSINNIVISTGEVSDQKIGDIRVFDTQDIKNNKLITSKDGHLLQPENGQYVYRLLLNEPEIIFTNDTNTNNWTYASAKNLIYTLDLSSMLPSFGEPSPTQVKNKELLETIYNEKENVEETKINIKKSITESIGDSYTNYTDIIANNNINFAISNMSGYARTRENIEANRIKPTFSYRQMYFESEYYKRFVLSFACIVLCLLAFSISFFKIRHGRLLGFALSMIVAFMYWTMLYFVQLNSMSQYSAIFSVALKMWLPDIFFLILALGLLKGLNKT